MSETIDIVFDGPPGPESGRFIEVEDGAGRGIRVGEWIDRGDGYWVLRMPRPMSVDHKRDARIADLERQLAAETCCKNGYVETVRVAHGALNRIGAMCNLPAGDWDHPDQVVEIVRVGLQEAVRGWLPAVIASGSKFGPRARLCPEGGASCYGTISTSGCGNPEHTAPQWFGLAPLPPCPIADCAERDPHEHATRISVGGEIDG
jgi:hypothetical protein